MINFRKKYCLVAACLSTVLSYGSANTAEIAPFRLTGVDGEAFVRFFGEEYKEEFDDIENRRRGATTEEGFDITLHSYIYHPNFFRLDFGGGTTFLQHYYEFNQVEESNNDQYLNGHARAYFLEKKPYPLMLYYDHHSSSTSYAVQDRMVLTSEKYGLNFKLRQPLSPALVQLDLSHSNMTGDNRQRITDEMSDRASIKVSGDLGSNGEGKINYTWTEDQSASGSRYLPIDENTRVTQLVDARTEHLFGDDEWIRFTNTFFYKEQDNRPMLEEFRYSPNLYLTHNKYLRSFYRYNYLDRTVEGIDTKSHALDVGLNHRSFAERLDTGARLHADHYTTEGVEQTFYQGDVDLSFLQPLGVIDMRYYGGWGLDYTDRIGDDISVFAETHTLDSFNAFELNNQNVIDSSVVVQNLAGTQTYEEGINYELIKIADITKVQWIDLDEIPEQVMVDYVYASGGTAEYTAYRQNYRIELNRNQLFRIFAGYRSIDRELQSGDPTIPLNSEEVASLGLDIDYPLSNNWTVGGKAEHERRNADVGSYRRDLAGVYLQIPRIVKGKLRLYADRLLMDHLESPEDVDLFRYGAQYESRLWHRTIFSADIVKETDTGGTRDKSNLRAKGRLRWTYRQLKLSAIARYDKDQIGESRRERRSINLVLSRRF